MKEIEEEVRNWRRRVEEEDEDRNCKNRDDGCERKDGMIEEGEGLSQEWG